MGEIRLKKKIQESIVKKKGKMEDSDRADSKRGMVNDLVSYLMEINVKIFVVYTFMPIFKCCWACLLTRIQVHIPSFSGFGRGGANESVWGLLYSSALGHTMDVMWI